MKRIGAQQNIELFMRNFAIFSMKLQDSAKAQ
jgi:hypothetical protein